MKRYSLYFKTMLWLMSIVGSLYGQANNNAGTLAVNLGIGASTMESVLGPNSFINLTTENSLINNNAASLTNNSIDNYNFISQTPACNVTVDYGISRRFSFGIGITYQSVIGNNENSQYNDNITRWNIAIRCLYHLHPTRKFDDYISLRSGVSLWKDDYNNPNRYTYFPLLTKDNFGLWSIQILYGYRYYFTNTVGLNFEVGLGSPYFAEGGLTFRINTKKPAAPQNTVPGQPKN